MTVVYPAIFTQTGDKKDTYLVSIPDLDGATEGHGLTDAIGMAKDYVGNALYDKSVLPAARAIKDIDVQSSEFAEAGTSFVSLIDVDLEAFRRIEKSRNVRRNITLPEWLDDMATAAKINVSAVAQSALKKRLGISV